MKKNLIIICLFALTGWIGLTAFQNDDQQEDTNSSGWEAILESDQYTAEQKDQWRGIKNQVEIKLDSFRMAKDAECRARALEVATERAAGMGQKAAPATKRPSGGSSVNKEPDQPKEEVKEPESKEPTQKTRTGAVKQDDPESQKERSGATKVDEDKATQQKKRSGATKKDGSGG